MNKKGFLLAEETLKIIIAVISIVFLVYFLTSLYFAKAGEQERKEAEATLISSPESLKATITNLNEGETQNFSLANPDGWSLFGFVDKKPNSCAGQNCLCICNNDKPESLL